MNIDDRTCERARNWLGGASLRPTRQRVQLAALLVGDGQNRHVTAETLFDAARESDISVSLATVYNTLRAFTEAGLLNEITVDATRSVFDTCLDDHAHYYWEDEGKLTDAPAGSVKIAGLPAMPEGTSLSRVDVVIRIRNDA